MPKKKERPNGFLAKQGKVWFLTYSVDQPLPDGTIKRKRKKQRLGEHPNKDFARCAADEFLASNPSVAVPRDCRVTLRQYIDSTFRPSYISKLKRGTQFHYETILRNHILPAFGDKRMDMITRDAVQRLVDYKLAPQLTDTEGKVIKRQWSVQSVSHCRNVLHKIYEYAFDKKHLSLGINPAHKLTIGTIEPKKPRPLSPQQSAQLLAALPSPLREMAMLALLCAMNKAEFLSLTWGVVNLMGETYYGQDVLPPYSLIVKRNYYRGEHNTTKTKSRVRCMALPQELVTALLALKARCKWTEDEDLVFVGPKRGKVLSLRNLEIRIFKPTVAKLGIPGCSWHALRHTWATNTDQLGFASADRKLGMGHASQAMTDYYTHADLDRRRADTERLAALVTTGQRPKAEDHAAKAEVHPAAPAPGADLSAPSGTLEAPKPIESKSRKLTKAREDAA